MSDNYDDFMRAMQKTRNIAETFRNLVNATSSLDILMYTRRLREYGVLPPESDQQESEKVVPADTERTLPQRMREAAKTLREADERRNPGFKACEYAWMPIELEGLANTWERLDGEDPEEKELIAKMARAWFSTTGLNEDHWELSRKEYEDRARELVREGWNMTRTQK